MLSFNEVIERFDEGPYIKEDEFDKKLSQKANEIVDKYDINFESDTVIPSDNELADRVFEAGLDLFLDLGIYCTDTNRLAKFSKDEVLESLNHAPNSVTFGHGRDKATLTPREVEDDKRPFTLFSAVGVPVSEQNFTKIVQSYVQEPLADTFSGPLTRERGGRKIKAGNPIEVQAAIWNVRKLREAAHDAQRPYIGCHNFMSSAERTDATIAGAREEFGARRNDGLLNAAIAELKVDFERLKRIAFLLQSPYHIGGLYGPLMGGMAGGPEATAVVLVAHHFLGVLAYRAEYHFSFPTHLHYRCNTSREMLWLNSVVLQSLSRNTDLLTVLNEHLAAGPCTETVLRELAASAITVVTSGGAQNPAAVAQDKHFEHCSGMEPKIAAEIGHAVASEGLTRSEANEIVGKLVDEYEDELPNPPVGKEFSECYDLEKVVPGDEYLGLYDELKTELQELGLDIST